MDSNTVLALVVVVFALIIVAIVIAFRKRIPAIIKGPMGTRLDVSATNEPTPPRPAVSIRRSTSRSGGALADDHTGRGAEIDHVQAEGDLLASSTPPQDGGPKAGPPA